jgi:hypothetical protein
MYRLIRGIKEDLFRVRPADGERRPATLLPSRLLHAPRRDLRHPAETCTLGLGPALLSKQTG